MSETRQQLAAPPSSDAHAPEAYVNRLSLRNRLARLVWGIVWLLLYRPSPRVCHFWRSFLLRLFGAKIARGVRVYPTAKIWAPWNLEMEEFSCLGADVDCYSVAPIRIESYATVSQYVFLCSASHDFEHPDFPLIFSPIVVGTRAWVAARAFVGPGVTIGAGAVVGATSSVYRDVEPWTVVGGNPARFIRRRMMKT
jgi:putative colanic acid biosynthesis acetyltransferase WcaF